MGGVMREEIKDDYMSFFSGLARTYENINKDFSKCQGTDAMYFEPRNRVKLFVRNSYFRLKELGVPDIESLRGCLNALEVELGMEVTGDEVGGGE